MSDFYAVSPANLFTSLKKGWFNTNTLQKLTAGRIEISKQIFIDVHFQKGVDFVGYLLIFLGAFQQGKACLSVPLYFRGRSLDFFGGSSNPPILSIWGNHGVLLEKFPAFRLEEFHHKHPIHLEVRVVWISSPHQ